MLTNYRFDLAFAAPLALIGLGFWQPLSGLLLGFWQNDSWRKKYLMGVIIWGICVGFLNHESFYRTPLEGISSTIYYSICAFFAIFPLLFALAYFRHSYIHLVKLLAQPRSFWELE